MSKMKISEYFNQEQHLTLHQDKEGNMIGGGYQVNNLLYQRKMPLFVSLGNSGGGQGAMSGGAGGGTGSDDCENRHFIPEKFSDLFRDLAVPAGLFMMPPQFRPRNYAFDVPEEDTTPSSREKKHGDGDRDGDGESSSDSSSSSSSDDEGSESNRRKTVPTDIFDTLLALVTPTERIQHDVKTRRQRHKTQQQQHSNKTDKKRQNKTRRAARD